MTGPVAALWQRIRGADALHANANALIVSTAVTSVAGLAFWALAARWLPADSVGIGTALVSVLTLLANVATLGLRNGMVRFLPEAGASTRRVITTSCLSCALAALALSAVFLVGQPLWAGQLAFLRDDAVAVVAFAGSTVVWVLFVLQDHVLIGLRKSVWVPVKNLAYSLGKIAALPLVATLSAWAVLGATVLPAVLAVVGVGVLVMALTRDGGAPRELRPPMSVGQLVRFAAADQIAWLVWVATPHVLTLIVLHVKGPEASAYYYMANMIGYSLYLVTSNIGSALIAESAHDPVRAASHARTALAHSVRLVFPLAIVGVLVGPFALRIMGEDYAAHAGAAMQLIILSALPQTIVGISVNTARVRHEMSTVVMTYVFLAVTIWGGSWITLQWWGVTGVGATILVAQSAAALGLVLTGRTGLMSGVPTADTVWAAVASLSLAARRSRSRRDQRRLLRPVLEACAVPEAVEARTLGSDSDSLVAAVSGPAGDFVLKIATTAAADRNLARHAETVGELHLLCDAGVTELVPVVVERVIVDGRTVVRETLLPGQTPTTDPGPVAAAAITRLHMATARSVLVTPELAERWIDLPAAAVAGLDVGDRHRAAVDRIASYLRDELVGRTITVSWTHGDYWPGNVLVSGDPPHQTVTGIIDWEDAMDPGLPDADLVHWYLSTRISDLGAAVCAALDDPGQVEGYFAPAGVVLPNAQLDPSAAVLLAWLWHVAHTRSRSTRSGPGRIWIARSVHPVLRRCAAASPSMSGGSSARHT